MTPFWERLLSSCTVEWLAEIRANAVVCEGRRAGTKRPKKTGTISEAAAVCLRALVERIAPSTCIEIGTFIGTSALVLAATGARVHTCDRDNAVLPSSDRITCYGLTGSTAMLSALQAAKLRAQLFFFDGRLQDADLPLVRRLSAPGAVYAFDDYEGQEKGVVNVGRLAPELQGYRLELPAGQIDGLAGRSTIAALVSEGWS